MRNLFMAGLSLAVLFSSCVQRPGRVEGLKVYQEDNILRNGDFAEKGLGREAPAHWCADYYNEMPEDMALYSLKGGTLRIQSPAAGSDIANNPPGIVQWLDVTPVTALEYTLSFEAEIESGMLACSVKSSEAFAKAHGKTWLPSQQIKGGKGFQRHSFPFKLDPQVSSDVWAVEFRPRGEGAVVKIRNVSLKPTLPETKPGAKAISIDDAGEIFPLRGIAVADNDSYFEHFYDLKAAQYLRKYLYVSFGRVVPIYTGSKEVIEQEKGMVCFGKSFIPTAEMAKVTAGGYALESKGGNIRIGGKLDGAVQGAFAILSGMGLEFFNTVDDFIPATKDVIRLANPQMIRNPTFAVRSLEWTILSKAPLGESCSELLGNNVYVGRLQGQTHTNGILVDPFIYFKDHPEYYALNKRGIRSWQVVHQFAGPGLKYGETMKRGQAYPFRMCMNLCWSNPEVQRIATETAVRWFELCPEMKMLTVLQGDGSDPSAWCQCDNCKNFGVSDSDRYLRFVNIIAKAVREKYPDKQINGWAYCMTFDAPVNVLPEPNVIINYAVCDAPWGKNGSPVETRIQSPACARGVTGLSNWMKTGVALGSALYFPSTLEAANKMRFLRGRGATNLFYAWYSKGGGGALTCYIMRKLSWDLSMDVDPLIARFMTFYYGPAAPAMRKFFNLVEEKKLAFANAIGQGDLGSDYIPLVVDEETLVKGWEYLDQAEAQVKRGDGRRMILDQKLEFLNSYLMRGKSVLLKEAALERFSKCLAEALRLAKELNSNAPRYGMTYPEMVWTATGIDVGNDKPWYNSPVVQKIWDDPLGMVRANLKDACGKTEKGLKIHLTSIAGGDEVSSYQWMGIPKSIRPYGKVLRRASSPKSGISAAFTLSGVPEHDAFLELLGLDDEKPGRASFKVLVNGKSVFDGENTFGEDDWSRMKISIPAKALKKGENTLEIQNTTSERISVVADIYAVKDYGWGWFMIAEAEIVFAAGENLVVTKEGKVLDALKKAVIEVHAFYKELEAGEGCLKGTRATHLSAHSENPLSDKWENLTFSLTPKEDCNLFLMLKGPYVPKEKGGQDFLPVWIEYDDLKIEGATLENPSFETLNDQMLPEGWGCVPANVITDSSAAGGKTHVRAWVNQPVTQKVAAKAGHPVTITAQVRRAQAK